MDVPIWVFVLSYTLLLFFIAVLAIFMWGLKQDIEKERFENAKLTEQIRELNISLKAAVGKMEFYRQEAIKIGNDYLEFFQQTKKNIDRVVVVINHFENENKRLQKQVADLTAQLANKTQVIEQLKKRVERTTGPLGGETHE